MPSRKKKSKAKGRKPAGKGVVKVEENGTADGEQKGTLDSEMQRLKIGEEKGDEDDVEAMLEEAIKLAAAEKQEIKVKEKENCTHGYNPSSQFQARFCEEFVKTFMESYYAAPRGNGRCERLYDAFCTAITTSKTTNTFRNRSNLDSINLCCLAEGTKFILDGGKSDAARVCGVLALYMKKANKADEFPDILKMMELLDADDHTLVQFFRKQIPCSCLDEKYKEVKSITKMGICFSPQCPLPGKMAVRSKMLYCTRCINGRNVSYCSRECQKADWPEHKKMCGMTNHEIAEMYSMSEAAAEIVQHINML